MRGDGNWKVAAFETDGILFDGGGFISPCVKPPTNVSSTTVHPLANCGPCIYSVVILKSDVCCFFPPISVITLVAGLSPQVKVTNRAFPR